MAWGEKKRSMEALEIENRFFQKQIDELKEEKRILMDKLDKAYDAIVAKEAPQAYNDRKIDEAEANLTEEERKHRETMKEITRASGELITEIEGPLFRSADDMRSMILKAVGPPKISSIHDNDES